MGKSWTLTILSGMNKGKVFKLSAGRAVIGRTQGEIILAGDEKVSGRHAVLVLSESAAHVTDLKSRNGLRVNGRSVEGARLKSGDRLVFGNVQAALTEVAAAVQIEVSEASPLSISASLRAVLPPPGSPRAQAMASAMAGASIRPVSAAALAMGYGGATARKASSAAPPSPLEHLKKATRIEAPTAKSFAVDAFVESLVAVNTKPAEFFEELPEGDEAMGPAVGFGLLCVAIETALAAAGMEAGLRVDTVGFGPGTSWPAFVAGLAWLILGNLVLLPFSALIVYAMASAAEGTAELKTAIKIACYSRGPMPLSAALACVPVVGRVLRLALFAYSFVLMGLGVLKCLKGRQQLVFALTVAVTALAVGGAWLSGDRAAPGKTRVPAAAAKAAPAKAPTPVASPAPAAAASGGTAQ